MRSPIRALALLVLSLAVPVEARAAGPHEVGPHPCRVPGYDQDVLCATYPVWENRATRKGRKIGLNIVILPALGPDRQPDPVFELGGGPGQGITESAGGLARSSLRQKRDLVLVDQRGTGGSNPLDCTLYGNPVDFRRAARELFRPAEIQKCRAKLKKVADLTRYTTAAFADDLNEVRQWLGYDRINLSGGSYGTRMAQVYLRRHPETVRSVKLWDTVSFKRTQITDWGYEQDGKEFGSFTVCVMLKHMSAEEAAQYRDRFPCRESP